MENLDINVLATIIDGEEAVNHFDELVAIGMRPSALATRMPSRGLAIHAEKLLSDGVSIDELATRIEQGDLDYCVEPLLEHGFDATKLAKMVSKDTFGRHIELFRAHGIDEDTIQRKAYLDLSHDMIKVLLPYNSFFKGGYPTRITAHYLLRVAGKKRLAKNCEQILKIGLNPNSVAKHLAPEGLLDNLVILARYGADVSELAKQLPPALQLEHYEELIRVGAKLDSEKLIQHVLRHHDNSEHIATVAIIAMEIQDSRLGTLENLWQECFANWAKDSLEENG